MTETRSIHEGKPTCKIVIYGWQNGRKSGKSCEQDSQATSEGINCSWKSLLASVSFSVSFWILRQGVARHRLISLANAGYILLLGGLAQLGERLLCKQEVSGSSPLISTILGR